MPRTYGRRYAPPPRTTARDTVGAMGAQSEKSFQAQVVKLAELFGWRVYHPFDSRRSVAGYPDLTLVRGNRAVWIELKTETGRVKFQQREWLAALAAVEHTSAHLFRPSDWDQLVSVLR